MRRTLTIWLMLCAAGSALGQGYDPAQVPRKARQLYEEALNDLVVPTADARARTVARLQEALRAYPAYLDAYVQLGSLYEKERRYAEALAWFEKADSLDPRYFLPGYLQYARAAAGTGDFSRALRLCDRYLQQPGLRAEERQRALDWQAHFRFGESSAARRLPFRPVNLGDSVNSPDPEYLPSLTIDQRTLIFTRNLGSRNEDFFISHRREDGHWSRALNIGPPVNSGYNEGAESISPDGRWLLFTICNRPGGAGSCDLYAAAVTDSGWSNPMNLGPALNSEAWESQPCLSPDNRDLYFISRRPGGYGGSDIYVSHRRADGRWGPPVNLGDSVNTAGDESSPFIHADNQTLYFASTGWPGVGGSDLYLTRRRGGGWTRPQNLGYPVNTIDHEGSLFVAADGETAYFASDRSDSRGLLDLYTFRLDSAARPVRTLYVQGHVYDRKTGAHIPADITLSDLDTDSLLSRIQTDSRGAYLVTLPVGRDYALSVSRPGYLFYADHFTLPDTAAWKPFLLDIPLTPIAAGARIRLNNIFFGFNSDSLEPASRGELDRLAALLEENPSLRVSIQGHTDSVGTAAYNLTLSRARAAAVVDYLVGRGIAAERLKAEGFGATRPVADNSSEEGRALNRRTEMLVLGK